VRHVPLELGRPVWVDDPWFCLGDHIRHATLPEHADEASLQNLTAGIMSEHLSPSRPRWETWLVDGLEADRWALVNKTHHAMIDGISGFDIITVLLDRDPEVEPRTATVWTPEAEPSSARLAADALGDLARVPLEVGEALARAARSPLRSTRHVVTELQGLVRAGEKVIRPESVLDGPLGPRRRWGWARADLARIRQVEAALGGTVNDVILAAIAGGFRTFLIARGRLWTGVPCAPWSRSRCAPRRSMADWATRCRPSSPTSRWGWSTLPRGWQR